MFAAALILVLASGMTHSIWNLFTKRSTKRVVFLWSLHSLSCICLLPYLIRELTTVSFPLHVYLMMLLSGGVQGCYIWLLNKTYAYGDMSQVYPFSRGTAAALIPLVSLAVFHERISWLGCIGLGIIIAGLFILSGAARIRTWTASNRKALLYAVSVGICITSYTLIDKTIIGAGFSPIALIEISNIGSVLVLTAPALSSMANLKQEWRINWKTIVLGSILSPGSYVLFLYAMKLAPLSHIAPVREISTVFGTLLGIFLLKESQGRIRIIMSACITCGIITLSLWG
ncbi:DMT family transporter [Paenibacillus thalictri]|uniref:LuxR family transcriptional regulator n=1 Tax=Paenibacillus thalictri TaxID=2527873 RepID=A0A4Q9DS64_9BACL|nr:DMT family transporter [Paenibacillus thalictri]TBL78604.1 LuxR family transcriptional regulator [Paenibacillus thalictri]